jgi:hypothetical protein
LGYSSITAAAAGNCAAEWQHLHRVRILAVDGELSVVVEQARQINQVAISASDGFFCETRRNLLRDISGGGALGDVRVAPSGKAI